jgi:hypothetical protein
MPRLVGHRSQSGLYFGLLVAIALIAAGLAEYSGIINLVPGWGRDQTERTYGEAMDPEGAIAAQIQPKTLQPIGDQ